MTLDECLDKCSSYSYRLCLSFHFLETTGECILGYSHSETGDPDQAPTTQGCDPQTKYYEHHFLG